MIYPIKVFSVELSKSIPSLSGLEKYMAAQVLVKLYGQPIGYTRIPITNGCIRAETLSKLILAEHHYKIIQYLLQNGLASSEKKDELRLEDLFDLVPNKSFISLPLVTVAICTRDRTSHLGPCLDAICQLDYRYLDILVIDNNPSTNATKTLIENKYPKVRYIREPRPGLNWARNRAIIEGKGEVIAYTDDDVIVDPNWIKTMSYMFVENPDVMAVTGLVVPYELKTEAQVLFEKYGGFGRGFERKWHRLDGKIVPWGLLGTGQFGTGANMAFRKSVFKKIGILILLLMWEP